MEFKTWFEAKLDPKTVQLGKQTWDGKPQILRSFYLKIDEDGNVVRAGDDDREHFLIEPSARTIRTTHLSPLSPQFHKIVKVLRRKYHDIDQWDVECFGQAGHMSTGNNQYNRTVGYWMKQKPVDINNKIPTTLYHGTCTNLLPTIEKKGLLPRSLTGSTGSYGAQNVDSLSQHDLVYVSVHPDAATRTAAVQAARKHGGRPLILKIDSSQLFPERFVPDEDARHAKTAQDSVRTMSIMAYRGKIPAAIIQPFLLGKEETQNNRILINWFSYSPVPPEDHPWTTKLRNGEVPYSGDPEHYIFKHAGIIGDEEYQTDYGRQTRTVKKRDADNDEILDLLKNGGWAHNVNAIRKDLDNGYRGTLYGLKGLNPPALPSSLQQTLDMLLRSGLAKRERDNSIYLTTWNAEKEIVALARLMGRMDFRQFLQNVREIQRISEEAAEASRLARYQN